MTELDESSVSSSEGTETEAITLSKVIEIIKTASKEIKESEDYLSYSTLLDLYLGEPSKYSNSEREELLEALLEILKNDRELTYKIGWDLPGLLILYVDLDFQFKGALRDSPGAYKLLKIFEVLALNGNHKELFLKCSELLSSIRVTDTTTTDDRELQEKFFDLKLYCIFELIDSCLKRIKTLYPSRLLSMAIVSFLNMVSANAPFLDNRTFISRRAYTFAKGYTAPPKSDNAGQQLSKEELKKIEEDEKYLQRKLLTGFFTQVTNILNSSFAHGFMLHMFSMYLESKRDKKAQFYHYKIENENANRCCELAYSFDIDLLGNFKTYLVDSHVIFHSLDYESEQDELLTQMFEKLVIDYQKNVPNTIIHNGKEINDSLFGCLMIYTHAVVYKGLFEQVEVSFYDALVFTLRTVIPGMVHPPFESKSMMDISVFWTWFAVYKLELDGKKLELEIAKIPSVLLKTFYQVLLHVCVTFVDCPDCRYCSLTLLTKLLFLSPAETTLSFITDSLKQSPYENLKTALVGVLKELLTKLKVCSLEEDLNKLSVNEKDSEKVDNEGTETTNLGTEGKGLRLTKNRLDGIFELVNDCIKSTFIKKQNENEESQLEDINCLRLNTLIAYFNLFVAIKSDPLVIENTGRTNLIISKVSGLIKELQNLFKKTDSEGEKVKLNAVQMLSITIDRLKT